MSYHNGSVWPHDNSLILWGLARSGFRDQANDIAGRLLEAASHFHLCRLPELMCGYDREPGMFIALFHIRSVAVPRRGLLAQAC